MIFTTDTDERMAEVSESLDLYVNHAIPPGNFLRAVLENDLFEAYRRADDRSLACLNRILAYVWNELPGRCWGSREKVAAWRGQSS